MPDQPDNILDGRGAQQAPDDAVMAAFAGLRDTLATAALSDPENFERATSFRAAVIGMAGRWAAGEPPTRKAKGSAS
jgi:hypothetical protein